MKKLNSLTLTRISAGYTLMSTLFLLGSFSHAVATSENHQVTELGDLLVKISVGTFISALICLVAIVGCGCNGHPRVTPDESDIGMTDNPNALTIPPPLAEANPFITLPIITENSAPKMTHPETKRHLLTPSFS